MDHSSLAFGVDLGGTKIRVGLVDTSGKLLGDRLIATRTEAGPVAITKDIADAIRDLTAAYTGSSALREPLRVGLAVAGQVDKQTGTIRFAPNLKWRDYPIREELGRLLGFPVWVTNDVRAAAWGEWMFGAGVGADDILCLFIGTGIGGGVVAAGRILEGATNIAGELGHVVVDRHGPLCTCGNHGCFEALAGGWAITRNLKEAVRLAPSEGKALLAMAAGDIDGLTTRHLFQAFRQNDPLAVRLFNELAEVLADGISGLVNAFNPKKLILGGGIIQGAPELVDRVRLGVAERSLKAAVEPLEVVISKLGADAGVMGAAVFAAKARSGGTL